MKTLSSDYEKAKERAKQIYRKIGFISSPALGDSAIVFAAMGFNHLVRKGRIPRPRSEQKRRFALLEHVERIVKNPRAKISYRQEERTIQVNRRGRIFLKNSIIHYWTFKEKIDDRSIKVVVSQIDLGKKHFLSVMGSTNKKDLP